MYIKLDTVKSGELHGMYFKAGNPHACIIMVHGLGEHIGRYREIAEKFLNDSYSFIGVDLPGHGKSPGKRGHISDFSLFTSIIEELSLYVENDDPGLPRILYGHSLGGAIALNYLVEKGNMTLGIITSPWLELSLKPAAWKIKLASLISNFIPAMLQPSGLKAENLSADETIVRNYVEDPLVHSSISAGLFNAATINARRVLESKNKLNTKILLMHGMKDRITSHKASVVFAENNSYADLKLWDNGYHELHNELFKEEVYDYIIQWLNSADELKNNNKN